MLGFFGCQISQRVGQQPGLFFILQLFPVQHSFGRGPAGGKAGADALQQQCFHEPGGAGALL